MISKLLSLAAVASMAVSPIALQAQEVAPAETVPAETTPIDDGTAAEELAAAQERATLGLPGEVQLLAPVDPNLRKATAVVNGEVITATDVDQRLALLLAANEQELPDAERQRVRMQVLRNLIDETLQIQAAKADEIAIEQAEVDQTYARLAAQNFGQREDAMAAHLQSVGSSPNSLKRQIRGELSWQRLLRQKVAPFVSVSSDEVNEMIKRLEANRGSDEYRLGEIFLAATAESATEVEANAVKIVDQLRQGGSFVAYARQFSQASTAAVGGDLGWIRLPQLKNEQLETVAGKMEPGQLVGPIAIPGGYSILYLIDKRQVLMADPRDAMLSLKQIQIDFEPGTTQEQNQGRLANFVQGVQSIRGCGDAESAGAALGATVVSNDQIRVRSLPEQLQSVVLELQLGQVTPPFGSVEDGVRVLMLCGRDDPEQTAGPDFDALMGQLEDERIDKRAQRYLRDLRNDAYIEYN